MSRRPTVVLLHGVFADASGFGGVIRRLQAEGLAVRAPMNPLRGLAFDADAMARYTTSIEAAGSPRGPLLWRSRHLPELDRRCNGSPDRQ